MTLPAAVEAMIDEMLTVVAHHPLHALKPFYRRRVYLALGAQPNLHGQRTCGWLAIITARRTLPFWSRVQPDDALPDQMLHVTERLLRGNMRRTEALDAYVEADQRLGVECFSEFYPSLPREAWLAGRAAMRTVLEAMKPHPFSKSYLIIKKHDTDSNIDPWSYDSAQCAVQILAGPVWESGSDSQKRREFWEWWLTQAIPTAWQME